MNVFLAVFVVFGLVMAGMAVGVIVSNRQIAGSCGGLANLQTDDGEPMCECGARPGDSCATDSDRRFDLDATNELDALDESNTIDEEGPATEREMAAV